MAEAVEMWNKRQPCSNCAELEAEVKRLETVLHSHLDAITGYGLAQERGALLEAALKAASTPRPMAEAPRDGKHFIVRKSGRPYIAWESKEGFYAEGFGHFNLSAFDGWYPLPGAANA